ncbi:MAG: HepT-like ribonuclease domain-containing protein, partial [Candidatus Hodarchaeales archaeon]
SIQLQDAVIRRVEIIGEAARNIPNDIKSRFTDIPWNEITGMRDILIHKYFGIDLELTWEVVEKDIPDLKERFLQIRKDLQ